MERTGSNLWRYCLDDLTEAGTISTKEKIYTNSAPSGIQALQRAPNKKIYLAFNNSAYLGVINYPDSIYNLVEFDTFGQYLGGKKSSYGLPAMVASFCYSPSIDFIYSLSCEDNHLILEPKTSISGSIFNWNITVSNKGTQLFSSSDYSPEYSFGDTGLIDISLQQVIGSDTFYAEKQIHISTPYKLNLGNDTSLCIGSNLLLNVGIGAHCYLWQDSSSGSSFLVDTSGLFYVRVVANDFCVYYDSIVVQLVNNPNKPTISSRKDTLFTNNTDSGFTYQWYINGKEIVGADSSFLLFSQNGKYQIRIFNTHGCSVLSDSFSVIGVGIQKPETTKYLIFPNPGTEGNNIQIEGDDLIESIRIYDVYGKCILTITSPKTYTYTLTDLKRGIYFLTINQAYTSKIMIE